MELQWGTARDQMQCSSYSYYDFVVTSFQFYYSKQCIAGSLFFKILRYFSADVRQFSFKLSWQVPQNFGIKTLCAVLDMNGLFAGFLNKYQHCDLNFENPECSFLYRSIFIAVLLYFYSKANLTSEKCLSKVLQYYSTIY